MPPPRCHPHLRPCLHACRHFNGPHRALSALRRGDKCHAPSLRALEQQQRSAWWHAIFGRKSESQSESHAQSHSADIAIDPRDADHGFLGRLEREAPKVAEPPAPAKAPPKVAKEKARKARKAEVTITANVAETSPSVTTGERNGEPTSPTKPKEAPAEKTGEEDTVKAQLQELQQQVQQLRSLLEEKTKKSVQRSRVGDIEHPPRAVGDIEHQASALSDTEYPPGFIPKIEARMKRMGQDRSNLHAKLLRLQSPAARTLKIMARTGVTMEVVERQDDRLRSWVRRNASPATESLKNYLDQRRSVGVQIRDSRTPLSKGSGLSSGTTARVAEKAYVGAVADGGTTPKKVTEDREPQYSREKSISARENVPTASPFTSLKPPTPSAPEKKPVAVVQPQHKMYQAKQAPEPPQQKVHNAPQAPEPPQPKPAAPVPQETSQSLLEELFPEIIAPKKTEPDANRDAYPKLNLPSTAAPIRATYAKNAVDGRRRPTLAVQPQSEPFIILQLLNASTQLTEADFRRLVPKGKHIDTWNRSNSEFSHVIPGRDPLTLERLPFYYLIFRTLEAALDYQNNVARLHKLAGLHRPTSIFSAIPPPPGFVEDGEDIDKVLSTYFLKPSSLSLNLNMVMQPYNPKLRELVIQGGYKPIVPSVDAQGKPLYKVLLNIEGWESSPDDLHDAFYRAGSSTGLVWPFHNGPAAFRRLRDIIDLESARSFQALSVANPRAATFSATAQTEEHVSDEELEADLLQTGQGSAKLSQFIMSKLYNRWVVEFTEEEAARRFARVWGGRVVPSDSGSGRVATWKDTEEVRMVNAEFLW